MAQKIKEQLAYVCNLLAAGPHFHRKAMEVTAKHFGIKMKRWKSGTPIDLSHTSSYKSTKPTLPHQTESVQRNLKVLA